MPRRELLTAAQRKALLAFPEEQENLPQYCTLSVEPSLPGFAHLHGYARLIPSRVPAAGLTGVWPALEAPACPGSSSPCGRRGRYIAATSLRAERQADDECDV
jgi:hypothetical protein